jgi:hypothetical protein
MARIRFLFPQGGEADIKGSPVELGSLLANYHAAMCALTGVAVAPPQLLSSEPPWPPPSPVVAPENQPRGTVAVDGDTGEPARASTAPVRPVWGADTTLQFMEVIRDSRRHFRFVAYLVEKGTANSEEVANYVGVAVHILGPIIRALVARAHQMTMEAPFTTVAPTARGKRYHCNPRFAEHAAGIIARWRGTGHGISAQEAPTE